MLLVTAALVVDGKSGQGEAVNSLDDEVDQIIRGNPVAQVQGQEQWRVAIGGVLEAV